MVSNLRDLLAFATKVFAQIIWFFVQNLAKKPRPILMLQIGAAVFAFVETWMMFAALHQSDVGKRKPDQRYFQNNDLRNRNNTA